MSLPVQFGKPGFKLQALGASVPDSGDEPESGPQQRRQPDGAHGRILLVEDDRVIRDVLLEILQEHGYAVTTAENGREALEMLQRGLGTDLIILDLRMPVMNGWQFRAAQKADPSLGAIPVLALSADGSAKAAAIDAAAYIRKPLSADAVLDAVSRILLDDDRRQLLRRLEEAERFAPLGRLAASVGHEINNPLASVSLNIDMLATQIRRFFDDHADALRALPAVPVMLNECRHGLDRVRDVGKRLQSLSLEAAPRERFSLNALLDDSLAMARIHVRERATVRKEYGDVPAIAGDRSALRQVFLSLILNAAHALPEGSAEANEITLRTHAEGDLVTAEIHDSGAGIPADMLLHIFDPYVTNKSRGELTGLDLPVAFRIVADHGGRIEVDSEIGRGTTFRVVLASAPAAAGTSGTGA